MATKEERPGRYVPALGRDRLTPLYDPLLRLTVRERAFKRRLLEQARPAAGMEVLDLGCGTGTLAVAAKQRAPGIAIRGLDGDPKVLSRAREKAARAGVAVEFDEGLSYELPYTDQRFDRVLSTLFFHHLSRADKQRTISEIRRVLKPGGELHVADLGPPASPPMRLLSWPVRLLDGRESTADNFAGNLPNLFAERGLSKVAVRDRLSTAVGTLVLYSAAR